MVVGRRSRWRSWGASVAHALTFLAVTVQVFLPFFVAIAIAQLSNPAVASTAFICAGHHGETAPPANRNPGNARHGLVDGGALCAALAAGHAVTPPAAIPLPLPRVVARAALDAPSAAAILAPPAAPYQSRAPPALG